MSGRLGDGLLIAVDIGTSGARAVALDTDGDRVLEVRRRYPTIASRPGWAEQSPAHWRSAAIGVLADLAAGLRAAGSGRADDVRAIGLTGQCPSIVLVDRSGRPVSAGLVYRDNRATAEAAALRERFGDAAMHTLTGHVPSSFHIAPKLMWLRTHEPDAFALARHALQPRDLVALELTGEVATDGTHAGATLLYDLRTGAWDPRMFDALGLDPDPLPARPALERGRWRPPRQDRGAGRTAPRDPGRPRRSGQPGLCARCRCRRPRSGKRDGRFVDVSQCGRAAAARRAGRRQLSTRDLWTLHDRDRDQYDRRRGGVAGRPAVRRPDRHERRASITCGSMARRAQCLPAPTESSP